MDDADRYNADALMADHIRPRHISVLTHAWQVHRGLEVDGKLGPRTRADVEQTIPGALTVVSPWEEFDGPVDLPRNRREVYDVFGHPGVAKADRRWRKKNIVSVRDLPGVDRWVDVHRLAEPFLREGLRRALVVSDYEIDRLGCFVFRHQRWDPARPLSYHAWGVAIDVNPDDNRPTSNPPAVWTTDWKQRWPYGVDRAFVEAMESVGWRWGGRWSWADPMHLELVAR